MRLLFPRRALRAEEGLKQPSTFVGQHVSCDFYSVIQARVGAELEQSLDGSSFGVSAPEDKARDAAESLKRLDGAVSLHAGLDGGRIGIAVRMCDDGHSQSGAHER